MEKRILIAFVLSFAVLYGFRWIFPPAAVPPETPVVQAPEVNSPPENPRIVVEEQSPAPEAAPADLQAPEVQEEAVDTPYYTATVSNHGGVLKSFTLKNYTDANGKPIELINSTVAAQVGWPLALVSGEGDLDKLLAEANYVLERHGEQISMEFAASGVHASKTFEFALDNYLLSVTTAVARNGEPVAHRLVWQGGFGDQSVVRDPVKSNIVHDTGADFTRLNVAKVDAPQEVTTSRVGVEDQYFLAAMLLPESAPVILSKTDYPAAEGATAKEMRVAAPGGGVAPVRVYVGPKQASWLRMADAGLEPVIDYGFFEILARPLLFALLWIHGFVGNFGWAIVILTIFINLVLFPLRLKQQVSMQKMQKIQPQMKTLQDKYKKLKPADPRRTEVQSEMMGLYKQHGVNPMGGCLPLLLQLPVFFAFLSVLSNAIELRLAPWMLWIKDLSQHDPYYVIPILMAVSMVITQKMTPSTVDPLQAKMMMLMPLLFTVMFLRVQAGLTLYWLTSNVVGIGQQWVINNYWVKRPDPTSLARPPKDRSLRGQ